MSPTISSTATFKVSSASGTRTSALVTSTRRSWNGNGKRVSDLVVGSCLSSARIAVASTHTSRMSSSPTGRSWRRLTEGSRRPVSVWTRTRAPPSPISTPSASTVGGASDILSTANRTGLSRAAASSFSIQPRACSTNWRENMCQITALPSARAIRNNSKTLRDLIGQRNSTHRRRCKEFFPSREF